MKWLATLFWMVIFFFVLLFSMQNTEEVPLRFVFPPWGSLRWVEAPETPLPLFVIVLGAVCVGILIAGLADLWKRLQLKRALRESQKSIERLERELDTLRGSGSGQRPG